ncbi:MAG: farnesyl diphosphate synthase [Eubacteriales bacterium]
MSKETTIDNKINEIEEVIQSYLPKEEGLQKTVLEAMNYSVLAGGKRLRPMLMNEMYRLYGGTSKVIEPFMVAIELIHTYSLVHDDLPAMDNDEYRRGRKTTHIVYGEDMAILAGDGLLNLAYEIALMSFAVKPDQMEEESCSISDELLIKAMKMLAHKAGVYGMIGGQVADVEGEGCQEDFTEEQLLFIHKNKTAAMIESALLIGAILANAPEEELIEIEQMGYEVGIAFQIQDDILDVTSSLEVLGKPIGSDVKNDKTTYVTLLGLEQAKEEVEKLSQSALKRLEQLSGTNDFLKDLLSKLITREK